MSGSVDLIIPTGTDWGVSFAWNDVNGEGYPYVSPVMTIRQGYNSASPLIARLDETGQAEGLLTITEPGKVVATMTASATNKLKSGTGFWDLYVMLWGNRVRMLFGTASISPHVTELEDV